MLGSESDETVCCPICFDDVPESISITLECCKSSYCLACLQRFVFAFVQSGKVDDVCCPNPECDSGSWSPQNIDSVFAKCVDADFELEDGRKLSRKEVKLRFKRFKMLSDAQVDELKFKKTFLCRNSECDGVLVPSDRTGAKEVSAEGALLEIEEIGDNNNAGGRSVVACRMCRLDHCGECFYLHSPNEACAAARKRAKKEDYMKTDKFRKRREMKIAARAIIPTIFTRVSLAVQPNVKRCPGCRKFIQKYYGCKHMYCSSCRTSFCWICTTPTGRGGSHCTFQKVVWPLSLLLAITFSAVYVPVMFLPWLAVYGVEKNILQTPRRERKHRAIWDQFYFINEMLAAFPY